MGKGRSSETNIDSYQLERETEVNEEKHQPIGIYGWRKRCLYSFILLLVILTVLNLALLVWMLRVLNFDVDGMRNVQFTSDGLRVEGQVELLDSLYTENIKSFQNKPLYLDSSGGVHIRSRDQESDDINSFVIANKTVVARSEMFEVKNSLGQTKLKVSDKGINFQNSDVTFTGRTSKVHITGSIATPNVRGPVSEPLRVEALSTQLHVNGDKGITMSAPAGKILIQSSDRLSFISNKNIYLSAENYYIKKLPVSSPQRGVYSGTVYQLCVCDNGKLFLSLPNADCVGTDITCQ